MLKNFYGKFLTKYGSRKDFSSQSSQQSVEHGHALHSKIQAEMAIQGQLAGAEVPLVDQQNRLVSRIDAISSSGEVIEIKTVGMSELMIMQQPRYQHKQQLIYYLNQVEAETGIVLYVAREAPGMRKAFRITVDGDDEQVSAAAIQYMTSRRSSTSDANMAFALKSAVEDYRSPISYARDYKTIIEEEKKLRKRALLAARKRAHDIAYKQAIMGLSEKDLISEGLGAGPAAKTHRGLFTDFNSPYEGKENFPTTMRVARDAFKKTTKELEKPIAQVARPLTEERQTIVSGWSKETRALQRHFHIERSREAFDLFQQIEALSKKTALPERPYRQGIKKAFKDLNLFKDYIESQQKKGFLLDVDISTRKKQVEAFSKVFGRSPLKTSLPQRETPIALKKKASRQAIAIIEKETAGKHLPDIILAQKVSGGGYMSPLYAELASVVNAQERGKEVNYKNLSRVIKREVIPKYVAEKVSAPELINIGEDVIESALRRDPKTREAIAQQINVMDNPYANTLKPPVRDTTTREVTSQPTLEPTTLKQRASASEIKPPASQIKSPATQTKPPSKATGSSAKPTPLTIAKEVTVDMEFSRPPSTARFGLGFAHEFAAIEATGSQMVSQMTKGLEKAEFEKLMREKVPEVLEGSTKIQAKFLDPATVERVQNTRSLNQLVREGFLLEGQIESIQGVAKRAGFTRKTGAGDALAFLKSMTGEYLQGVGESTGKTFEFHGKYKNILGVKGEIAEDAMKVARTSPFMTAHVGDFVESQTRLFREIELYHSRLKAGIGAGEQVVYAGQNIQQFDIPNIVEGQRIYGIDNPASKAILKASTEGGKEFIIRDTLGESEGARRYGDNVDIATGGQQGKILVDTPGDSKVRKGLKTQDAMRQVVRTQVRGSAHTALVDNANNYIVQAYQETIKKDVLQKDISEAIRISNELDESRLKIPKKSKIEISKKLIEPEELIEGAPRKMPESTRVVQPRSTYSKVRPQLRGIVDGLLGHGTYREMEGIGRSVGNALKDIGVQYERQGHGQKVAAVAEDLFGKSKVPMRGKNMALLGGAATLVGLATVGVTSFFSGFSSAPNRPIKITKPMSISSSGNDEDHVKMSYKGKAAQIMKKHYTDFGSGYHGPRGSTLALASLHTPISKHSNPSIPTGFNLGSTHAFDTSSHIAGTTSDKPSVAVELPTTNNRNLPIIENQSQSNAKHKSRQRWYSRGRLGTYPVFSMNHNRCQHTRM